MLGQLSYKDTIATCLQLERDFPPRNTFSESHPNFIHFLAHFPLKAGTRPLAAVSPYKFVPTAIAPVNALGPTTIVPNKFPTSKRYNLTTITSYVIVTENIGFSVEIVSVLPDIATL